MFWTDRESAVHCCCSAVRSDCQNDTEDPEERRKRIEAQEAGANAGALIGLAVGIVSELAHRDDTPAEEKETEEQEFTMNM